MVSETILVDFQLFLFLTRIIPDICLLCCRCPQHTDTESTYSITSR